MKLGEHLAGALVRFADEDHVRREHVSNDTAESDELGIVAEPEVTPAPQAGGALQSRQEVSARRTRHYRAGKDDQVECVLVAQRLSDQLRGRKDVTQGEA